MVCRRCCSEPDGSEFTGQMMDMWAYRNGVSIDFSRSGLPSDNAHARKLQPAASATECLMESELVRKPFLPRSQAGY